VETGLRDRRVLVTGGSRGIGRAVVLAYVREGARVALTYGSDEDAAASVLGGIPTGGGEACALRLDLADRASIADAVDEAVDRLGGLDVVVANAVKWPYEARGTLAELHPEAWEAALRANLEGTAATARAGMPHLSRSDAGRLVLVSSGVSRDGRAGATAYATAKAALDGLVAALKWEAGPLGVLVNIVSPGFTLTEGNYAHFADEVRESVRSQTPTGRLSTPEDVAAAIVFLGSPANGNISGAYLPVAGGTN
jgi:NAD(P)-dependent dehydrogenase (short-subunit alcohol dehydrogenase family)